jgi:hypothetical protein
METITHMPANPVRRFGPGLRDRWRAYRDDRPVLPTGQRVWPWTRVSTLNKAYFPDRDPRRPNEHDERDEWPSRRWPDPSA